MNIYNLHISPTGLFIAAIVIKFSGYQSAFGQITNEVGYLIPGGLLVGSGTQVRTQKLVPLKTIPPFFLCLEHVLNQKSMFVCFYSWPSNLFSKHVFFFFFFLSFLSRGSFSLPSHVFITS